MFLDAQSYFPIPKQLTGFQSPLHGFSKLLKADYFMAPLFPEEYLLYIPG